MFGFLMFSVAFFLICYLIVLAFKFVVIFLCGDPSARTAAAAAAAEASSSSSSSHPRPATRTSSAGDIEEGHQTPNHSQQPQPERQLIGRILKSESLQQRKIQCATTDTTETTTDMDSNEDDNNNEDDDDDDKWFVCHEVMADFGDRGVFTVQDDHSACTICLVEYEHGDRIQRNGTCDHIFHETCIVDWLKTGSQECPCCRCEFNHYTTAAAAAAAAAIP